MLDGAGTLSRSTLRRLAPLLSAGRRGAAHSGGAGETARLYLRRGTRFEAHLGRSADGRTGVLLISLGRRGARRFAVDAEAPWEDFERQAGLRGSAWGPCRDVSAGL